MVGKGDSHPDPEGPLPRSEVIENVRFWEAKTHEHTRAGEVQAAATAHAMAEVWRTYAEEPAP